MNSTPTASDRPILIFYASNHGQTEKIVHRVADCFPENTVELVNVKEARSVSAGDFEAVIVAASVHAGHHQRKIVDWVKRNRDELTARPNAFLSVSLSAADEDEEGRESEAKAIKDFTDETGWIPARSEPIAGALQYREYDAFTRLFMKLLMKRTDKPFDTSRDYDYTDWEALDRLGAELAGTFLATTA